MTLKNKKAKGSQAERELFHQFWAENWVCMRAAGSGSNQYPSPDLLASNGGRKLVLEIKSINDTKKYIEKQQIKDLELFATKFGAEGWIGIKFEGAQWYFLPLTELGETNAQNYAFDLVEMKRKGFTFDQMIGNFKTE